MYVQIEKVGTFDLVKLKLWFGETGNNPNSHPSQFH